MNLLGMLVEDSSMVAKYGSITTPPPALFNLVTLLMPRHFCLSARKASGQTVLAMSSTQLLSYLQAVETKFKIAMLMKKKLTYLCTMLLSGMYFPLPALRMASITSSMPMPMIFLSFLWLISELSLV